MESYRDTAREFVQALDGVVFLAPQSLKRCFGSLAIVVASQGLELRALNVLTQAHGFGSHRDAVMPFLSPARRYARMVASGVAVDGMTSPDDASFQEIPLQNFGSVLSPSDLLDH